MNALEVSNPTQLRKAYSFIHKSSPRVSPRQSCSTVKLARLRSPLLPLPVLSLALTPPPDHPCQLAPFQFPGLKMEEPPVLPPPATLEPISRPSSASTTASQKDSLPGISAIAAAAAAAAAAVTSSPQLRYVVFLSEMGMADWNRSMLSDSAWDWQSRRGSFESSLLGFTAAERELYRTGRPAAAVCQAIKSGPELLKRSSA